MAYTAYASYVVYFANQAEYDFAVALAGSPTLEMSPADVAIVFGFVDGVNYNTGGAINPDRGMYGLAPYGIPAWPGPGVEVLHPGPSGKFLKSDVLSVLVPGQSSGGFPPGQDMTLIWSATLTYTAYPTVSVGTNDPVPRRRWTMGWELRATSEGGTSMSTRGLSRDSSRTLDGLGWGLRNSNNENNVRTLAEYDSSWSTATSSWERFYIRIRAFGSVSCDIWRSSGLPSPASGGQLVITNTGDLQLYNVTAFSVFNLLSTIPAPFTLNVWHRVDIRVAYNPSPSPPVQGNGYFHLYIDGINVAAHTIAVGSGGLGAQLQTHATTIFGTQSNAIGWEIDFDDWLNAETDVLLLTEPTHLDWFLGTHVKRQWGLGTTQTGWTGQPNYANQLISPLASAATSRFASVTSGAQIDVLADVGLEQDVTGIVFATNCVNVGVFSVLASGAAGGRLGYSLDGASFVTNLIVENVVGKYSAVLYPGTGVDLVPLDIFPLLLRYQKAANAVNTQVLGLQATVEYLGVWGPEDAEQAVAIRLDNYTHNAWYPALAAALIQGAVSDAAVCAVGGTYVGNGTTQTIALPLPCHFLWIQPNASSPGSKWWGSCLGGHKGPQFAVLADSVMRCQYDPLTGISSFTVMGSDPDVNQAATTYQYIAFCDPMMMYNICGAFRHATSTPSASNPLCLPLFTPSAAFFQLETLEANANTALSFKGPGNTTNEGQLVDGTNQPLLAQLNTGLITSLASSHNSQNYQTMYSIWDTGANTCGTVMVQIFSYVGNGVNPRVITCTPTSGRFPLLIYVQPHNAAGQVKTPSDGGTQSRSISSGGINNQAIIAVGVDSFQVGATCNANGIIHEVFVICGSFSSFQNGTFAPGNCINTEWPPEPPEPPLPGIAILGAGGLVLSGQPGTGLLQDVSGIYTIVQGKRHDTLYDRQTGQPNVDTAIPNPNFKTGYVGG